MISLTPSAGRRPPDGLASRTSPHPTTKWTLTRITTQRRLAALCAALALGLAGITAGAAGGSTATAAAPAPQTPVATADATPHQWLTGYWHNFDNGSTTLRVSEIPAAYNLVAIAFADADPARPDAIAFNLASAELGGYTVAQFKVDVAAVRAQERKVILSIGGEKGNVVVDSSTAATSRWPTSSPPSTASRRAPAAPPSSPPRGTAPPAAS